MIGQNNYKTFEESFVKYGTDKHGYHTYTGVYSSLFKDLSKVRNVLEVGIHLGASIRAWKDVFEFAEIVGVDNNPNRFIFDDRIMSMYLDQGNNPSIESFKKIYSDTEFDLIVDDGCHFFAETYNTFIHLLEKTRVGGFYVIEDIQSHLLDEWIGIVDELPKTKFSYVVHDMNDKANTNGDNIMIVVSRTS